MGRSRLQQQLWIVTFLGALASPPALAQPVFGDDFEGSSLLDAGPTPGRWSGTWLNGAGSLQPLSAAAHRGAQGLQLVDNSSSAGTDSAGGVSRDFSPISPEVYLRFWMKIATLGQAAPIMPAHF